MPRGGKRPGAGRKAKGNSTSASVGQVKAYHPAPPEIVEERPRTRGRPPSYQAAFAKQAEKLCALGATDIELADFFEVEVRTIYAWRNTHDEFSQAVIAGKDGADDRVERSLFNRAVGYTYESEKIFQHKGEIIRADTREHVPPDAGAAMNWLKNRRPEKWRDKVDHTHAAPDGGAVAFTFKLDRPPQS